MLILSGCLHKDDDTDVAESCGSGEFDYLGCWVSQECKQAEDGQGNLFERWFKSEYNFTPLGKLEVTVFEYLDSSCSGGIKNTNIDAEIEVKHLFVQEIINDEGLTGSEVKITMISEQTTIEVNGGIFVTSEEELCSTKSLNFGPDSFGISAAGLAKDTELYENCLVRGKLP